MQSIKNKDIEIKDPIHGFIELNEIEKEIIDSLVFQRLRNIKQLATAYLVYPGATHTRFSHSLGTLFLASKMAEHFSLDESENLIVRVCALLHDVGHFPFSHDSELVLSKYVGTHEENAKRKIEKSELKDILLKFFSKTEVSKISNFNSLKLFDLISSDIGADRMDYLNRDAYYTGVAYGIIDSERLIGRMHFDGREIYIDEGGLEASESLLIARFMMFSTVYLHPTVRIASAMLRKAISIALENNEIDAKNFIDLDDFEALYVLSKTSAKDLIDKIRKRELYKKVLALDFFKTDIKELEEKISSISDSIIIDIPQSFYKLKGFDVVFKNGEKKNILKASSLVSSLKRAEKERMKILILSPKEKREKILNACSSFLK